MRLAELTLCVGVYAAWIAYSFWQVVAASSAAERRGWLWRLVEKSNCSWPSPLPSTRDAVDWHWTFWRAALPRRLSAFAVHALVWRVADTRARLAPILVDVLLHVFAFGGQAVLVVVAVSCCAVLATAAAVALRIGVRVAKTLAWLMSAGVMWWTIQKPSGTFDDDAAIRRAELLSYKQLQLLSFCLSTIDSGSLDTASFVQYLTYLPYSSLLIVPYERFRQQRLAPTRPPRLLRLLSDAARLLLWFCCAELLLHVAKARALLAKPAVLTRLLPTSDDLDRRSHMSLFAVLYWACISFYLTYIARFGLNSWFARLDGMRPPAPPVCVARVSRGASVWRHFDRGIHDFMRAHVFDALTSAERPSLACSSAVAGVCFALGAAWHGCTPGAIACAVTNVACSTVESAVKRVWRASPRLRAFVRWRVGAEALTRLQAALRIPLLLTFFFSLAFFFGSNDGASGLIVARALLHFFVSTPHGFLVGATLSYAVIRIDTYFCEQSAIVFSSSVPVH